MLFSKRFWAGIADGSITMTFRRWTRANVVAGRRYRTGGGIVEVESVEVVGDDAITDEEAHRAGFADAAAVAPELGAGADRSLYRIVFHLVDEPDPRALLADDDALDDAAVAAIERRLRRMDAASSHGPWTHQTLELIAAHPERRAPDLAALVGRETQPFKRDVRKLKELGLTLSFPIGYRLSPRGEAYLAATSAR